MNSNNKFDGSSVEEYISSSTGGISPRRLPCNLLMCIDVFKLTGGHPIAIGFLRSAGSMGASVFYELIEADHVPIHAKVVSHPTTLPPSSDSDHHRHLEVIPIHCSGTTWTSDGSITTTTPTTTPLFHQPHPNHSSTAVIDTLVASHVPMVLHALSLDALRGVPINHLQYVCHPSATTLESVHPQPSFEDSITTPSIEFIGFDGIAETPVNFLCDLSDITSIDITPFANVTHTQRFFLAFCTSLITLDASPMRHITVMGDYFMNGCSNLTNIDISGFTEIASIGDFFLAGCKKLESIDLGAFSNVGVIGKGFLGQCYGLKTVDIAPLRSCSRIGRGFMQGFKAVPPKSGLAAVCSVEKSELGEALQGVLRHLKLN